MYGLMFRSRWFALIWAAMILCSIAFRFAPGGPADMLTGAAGNIAAERAALERPGQGHRLTVREEEARGPEDDGFSSDKEVEYHEER